MEKINPSLIPFLVNLSDLTLEPKNPRVHNKKNLKAISDSLAQFGQQKAIVISKDKIIIAGNGTFAAAKQLGWTKIAALIMDSDDPKVLEGFKIADNRSSELAEWDDKLLAGIFDNLQLKGVDLTSLGWENFEISDLLTMDWTETEQEKADKIPELPEVGRTLPGSVIQMDEHRLMCGDSTNLEDMKKLMGGQKANLLITSPPYWVGKEYETEKSVTEVIEFIHKACLSMASCMSEDYSRIVINTANSLARLLDKKVDPETLMWTPYYIKFLKEIGWLMRHQRIWVKSGGLPGPIHPATDVIDQNCEFISTFYFPKGKHRGRDRIIENWSQQGYWNFRGEANALGHPAAFPVELPRRNIMMYSRMGEIVMDLFGGSGSTLIAATTLKRRAFLMERDTRYCDVIIKRYCEYVGIDAEAMLIEVSQTKKG